MSTSSYIENLLGVRDGLARGARTGATGRYHALSQPSGSLALMPGSRFGCGPNLLSILFVSHLLHPLDHLAVLFFVEGDVHHGGGGSGAVPVLLAGSDPDHITWPNFLHRPAPALHPAAACRNDESLAERMGVPRSARARLKSYAGALKKRRIGRLDKWINPHRPGEPFRRTFDRSLRTHSLDLHLLHSSSTLRIASFQVPGLLLWSKANQHLHARLPPSSYRSLH